MKKIYGTIILTIWILMKAIDDNECLNTVQSSVNDNHTEIENSCSDIFYY